MLIWKKYWWLGWSQIHRRFSLPCFPLETWKTWEGCFVFTLQHPRAQMGTSTGTAPMRGQNSDWTMLHWPNNLAWTTSDWVRGSCLVDQWSCILREMPFMNYFKVCFCRDHHWPINKGLGRSSTLQSVQWGEILIAPGWGRDEKKQVRQPELPSLAAASQNVLTMHRKPIGGYTNLLCLLCIFEVEDWASVQTHNLCEGMSQQIGKG